ncbi:YxeA family protein [Bacillus mycoides]|uniref:YxeA family protein n=1 Tax=Bacillus mycoides TaxID=1405 RepID=UPI002112A28E|nr:YxeA family protein [Bacillus mycoides]MCQ6531189.1 YxeA family protein [Bacillus mycoides]
MKRYLMLFSCLLVFCMMAVGCNIYRIGTEAYYVQITTNGEPEKGPQSTQYEYSLQGFNEKGEAKELKFSRDKEIKKGAFMKVFYNKDRGVKGLDEVKKEDIPEKAKEKLNVK